MILSFHPCYVADENRICAERPPDGADLERIRSARAVILPQGCKPELYAMVRANAAHVFPNYAARFDYPGKTDQIRLFRELGAAHPASRLYLNPTDIADPDEAHRIATEIGYPLVFKLDFGGEGDTVVRIEDPDHLMEQAQSLGAHYRSPCLVQQFTPGGQRSLRVVVIGQQLISYWRVNPDDGDFGTSAGKGARIDHQSDPHLQLRAHQVTREFCRRSGINLAGFDFLFAPTDPTPLFLEINHFFGRRGLGGSESFYTILAAEIDRWLAALPPDEGS